MNSLPPEVLREIFSYLDRKQLAPVERVNKLFHQVALTLDPFWQTYGTSISRYMQTCSPGLRMHRSIVDSKWLGIPRDTPYAGRKGEEAFLSKVGFTAFPEFLNRERVFALTNRYGGVLRQFCASFHRHYVESYESFCWSMEELHRWGTEMLWLEEDTTCRYRSCGSRKAGKRQILPALTTMLRISRTITVLRLNISRVCAAAVKDFRWFDQDCSRPPFKKLSLHFAGSDDFILQAYEARLLEECELLDLQECCLSENETWIVLDQAKESLEYLSFAINWSMPSSRPRAGAEVPHSIQFSRLKELSIPPSDCEEYYQNRSKSQPSKFDARIHVSRPRIMFPQLRDLHFAVVLSHDLIADLFASSLRTISIVFGIDWLGHRSNPAKASDLTMMIDRLTKLHLLECLALERWTFFPNDVTTTSLCINNALKSLTFAVSVPLAHLTLYTDVVVDPRTLLSLIRGRLSANIAKPIQRIELMDQDDIKFRAQWPRLQPLTTRVETCKVYQEISDLVPQFFVRGQDVKEILRRRLKHAREDDDGGQEGVVEEGGETSLDESEAEDEEEDEAAARPLDFEQYLWQRLRSVYG